jgi:hypothetical protein
LFCLATLALLPIVANWPVTSGWLTVDPIYWTSGLGVGLQPGPLPGFPGLQSDATVGWIAEALGRFATNEWMAGRIPWWNPYSGAGLPLVAVGQVPALFLPFVFLLALPNGIFLLTLVLQQIAAFAMFALLRCLKLGQMVSWVGAALYCLNGTFAWFGGQLITPIAFAPLLLLGIEMEWKAAAQGQIASRGWMVAAVAVAMSLYAAFPETAYIDGLLGMVWATQRFAVLPAGRRFRFAGRTAGAAMTGVLLAAPYVIPFAHMLMVGDISVHAGLISKMATPASGLPVLSMPYVLGPPDFRSADATGKLTLMWMNLGGYVTLPELVVAAAALLTRGAPHRGLRLVLGAVIAVTVSASFGVPGTTQVVHTIPGLGQAWFARYAAPSSELAFAVLAAMTIQDWRKGRIGPRQAIGSAILVALATTLSFAAAWQSVVLLLTAVEPYVWWLATSVLTATVAVIAVTACMCASPTQRRLCIALASVVGYALCLFMVPRFSGLREARIDERAIGFLRGGLGFQRFYAMGPIMPNYGAYFGIASLNSLYVPEPQIWADHIATALDSKYPVVFVFSGTWPPQSDRVIQFLAHLQAFAALSVRYVVVSVSDDTLPRLASAGAQPLRLAYEDGLLRIFEVTTASPYFEAISGACRVTPQSRERVVTECAQPTRLIRRELFFDGWRATVNGKRAEIDQEGIVQAVDLPAGSATVAFRYAPPYAGVSAGLALVGILILVGGDLLAYSSRLRFAWRRSGSSCPPHGDWFTRNDRRHDEQQQRFGNQR